LIGHQTGDALATSRALSSHYQSLIARAVTLTMLVTQLLESLRDCDFEWPAERPNIFRRSGCVPTSDHVLANLARQQ